MECEMKLILAHLQLKVKLNMVAVEREKFKAEMQKLEQDNKVMSETFTEING